MYIVLDNGQSHIYTDTIVYGSENWTLAKSQLSFIQLVEQVFSNIRQIQSSSLQKMRRYMARAAYFGYIAKTKQRSDILFDKCKEQRTLSFLNKPKWRRNVRRPKKNAGGTSFSFQCCKVGNKRCGFLSEIDVPIMITSYDTRSSLQQCVTWIDSFHSELLAYLTI